MKETEHMILNQQFCLIGDLHDLYIKLQIVVREFFFCYCSYNQLKVLVSVLVCVLKTDFYRQLFCFFHPFFFKYFVQYS